MQASARPGNVHTPTKKVKPLNTPIKPNRPQLKISRGTYNPVENPNPSLSKRSKSEVKHKVMHHYILKAAALKEKGRPSRLKTE